MNHFLFAIRTPSKPNLHPLQAQEGIQGPRLKPNRRKGFIRPITFLVRCRNQDHDEDGDPKMIIKMSLKFKKMSRHHSLLGKLWKNRKVRLWSTKPDFESGSRLRVGKVLAPPQRPS